MGGENLAGPCSSPHSLVKAPRHGLAEVLDRSGDEGLLTSEVDEDRAVGDSGFLRDIGGGRLKYAVAAEYDNRRIQYAPPSLELLLRATRSRPAGCPVRILYIC